jgi:fluoroquinolone resistance protein
MKNIYEHTVFDNDAFTEGVDQEYSDCTFVRRDFMNRQFHSARLEDCTFDVCNLSMVKFDNAILNRVHFRKCKIVGVDFAKCSKMAFSLAFEECILDYALFRKNNLKNFVFKDCRMQGTNFIESNLSAAKFFRCDLEKAVFEGSNLEKADFISSWNYSINPETNKLKKTKFSLPHVIGLLGNLDIIIE